MLMGDTPIDAESRGIRPAEESDVYALGMTFLELGTLQLPFHEVQSPFKALEMAVDGKRPAQPEILGGLSPVDLLQVWDRMTKMWIQAPKERIKMKALDSFVSRLWARVQSPDGP